MDGLHKIIVTGGETIPDKENMLENASKSKPRAIGEDELNKVTGGADSDPYTGGLRRLCDFTWKTGQEKTLVLKGSAGATQVWRECNSGCATCACYEQNHCVGKWHLVNGTTKELYPEGYRNHSSKKASNSYNT